MNNTPLPTGPQTDEETMYWRRERRNREHARWALRFGRRLLFWIISSLTALYGAYEILSRHVTWR